MKAYSDALVELGNQAWILNVALAELHRFDQLIDGSSHSMTAAALSHGHQQHSHQLHNRQQQSRQQQGRQQLLHPAIARLQTRLQALLSKWQRRMTEESGEVPSISYQPWGCQVRLPDSLRSKIKIETFELHTLAQIRSLALRCADDFFICSTLEGKALMPDRPSSVASLIRLSGVDRSVAQMWWSWCLGQDRLHCRVEALTDNLWHGDSCLLPKG